MKPDGFMVMYDDACSLTYALGWDALCEGGLQISMSAVVFPDRASARRAIKISELNAKLLREQGKPHDDCWTEYRKYIRIRTVVMAKGAKS